MPGKPADVLDRAEQLRIAELRGYQPAAGLLPVEQFMRDYFRHTEAGEPRRRAIRGQGAARDRIARLVTVALRPSGAKTASLVGPAGDHGHAARAGVAPRRSDGHHAAGRPGQPLRQADRPRHVGRRSAATPASLPKACPPPEACRIFLSLLGASGAGSAPLLRDLHDAHLLERFIPDFRHARGLLQFNQYHKYTVDEHCLRAVEFATELGPDPGPLGRVYRAIAAEAHAAPGPVDPRSGQRPPEDHREVGVRIADETAPSGWACRPTRPRR